MFIVKNSVTLKTILIIVYFFLLPCQYYAFGSTVRLVPLADDNISESGLKYALVGEDLDGLGSVEVTLRYPSGMYDNVQVVFDDTLQSGSSVAQANTNSPDSVRIGIINAGGFTNLSRELAYISFENLQENVHPFRLSGSVVVTDLNGKKVDSNILIEQDDEEVTEIREEDEVVDAVMPLDSNIPEVIYKTPSAKRPRTYHSNIRPGETDQGKKKINLETDENSDSIKGYKPRAFYKNKQKNRHALKKSTSPQITKKSSNISKKRPVEYEIQKDKEKSGIYVISIDLPREKLNFVLVNGEIINLVQVDKKVNLKIIAENECTLYIFTDTIVRIALDDYNKGNRYNSL